MVDWELGGDEAPVIGKGKHGREPLWKMPTHSPARSQACWESTTSEADLAGPRSIPGGELEMNWLMTMRPIVFWHCWQVAGQVTFIMLECAGSVHLQ